jgi:hypothetical protein
MEGGKEGGREGGRERESILATSNTITATEESLM